MVIKHVDNKFTTGTNFYNSKAKRTNYMDEAQTMSMMSSVIPNQVVNDKGVVAVPNLLSGRTSKQYSTIQDGPGNFMALRNSRNNSKAIMGDKSQLSRHTSALTQKSRLGGLKSSGQNRIVTGVEELRIKQENIDKVMMNKMHQEN